MKVNGPVLLGSEIEVDVIRRPVVAVHCPGGPVYRVAVQPIFGHVGDPVGGEVSAEVPRPNEAVPDLRGRSAVPQRFELPQAQGAPEQGRPVDLAVEVAGDPGSGGVLPFAIARHDERHAIFGDFELPLSPFRPPRRSRPWARWSWAAGRASPFRWTSRRSPPRSTTRASAGPARARAPRWRFAPPDRRRPRHTGSGHARRPASCRIRCRRNRTTWSGCPARTWSGLSKTSRPAA